jgi:putative sterol carrier protein
MSDLQAIDLAAFYLTYLPKNETAPADPLGLGYQVQHEIGASSFAVIVAPDGTITTHAGAAEDPLFIMRITEDDWRAALTGNIDPGPISDPQELDGDRLQKLRDLRGTLNLELSRPGAEPWRAVALFNQAATPAVTLMMAAVDYTAMQRGELSSQMAFMTGKLKFQGDLNLLMKIGSLLG